jgi:hypothetical protein
MAGPPGKDISGDRKGVVVLQMVVNINNKALQPPSKMLQWLFIILLPVVFSSSPDKSSWESKVISKKEALSVWIIWSC